MQVLRLFDETNREQDGNDSGKLDGVQVHRNL